jgi:hypothetical protein
VRFHDAKLEFSARLTEPSAWIGGPHSNPWSPPSPLGMIMVFFAADHPSVPWTRYGVMRKGADASRGRPRLHDGADQQIWISPLPPAGHIIFASRRTGRPIAFDAVPSQIPAMPAHRFRVGQTVVVPWSGPEGALPLGPYVIVRLLPLVAGEPQYRVRSSVDGHERALLESQIRLQGERPALVEPPPMQQSRPRR